MRISDWSSDVCSSDLEVRRRSLGTSPLGSLGILLPLPQSEFGHELQRIIDAVGRQQDLRIPKLEIIARTVDEDDVINAAELLEERRNEETAAIIEGHVFQQAEFPLHCRRAIIAFAPGQGELLFMIDVGAQGPDRKRTRERVRQNVSISVVAVTLKKNERIYKEN